jgi:DNA-binding IclR family transcriptional regulator
LGERLLRLLHAGSDGAWLAIAVQPILNDLANQLDETCYLARLAGHEVVSTAWATPNSGLRGYVVPGYKLAPHVAASAKAIMAFQPTELIDKALTNPLPKLTKNTKSDRARVEREYAQVRAQGYATCWNEMEIGLGAIAVPIPLPEIGVIYSVGIAGLIDRLTRRSEQESVKVLNSAVDSLKRALRDLRREERVGSRRRG